MMKSKTALLSGILVAGLASPLFAQMNAGAASASASANASGVTANTPADSVVGATAEADASVSPSGKAPELSAADKVDEASEARAAPGQATVGELIGQSVASAAGESIGQIDNIVELRGETMVVLGVGGLFGFGEHDVALPVTELMFRGESVTAMGYTREQLKSMREFEADLAKPVGNDVMITLGKS